MSVQTEPDADCLIFIHIGKTAGTTFNRILASRIFEHQTFGAYDGEINSSLRSSTGIFEPEVVSNEIVKREAQRNRQFKYFPGHMRFGLHAALKRSARYVTFLRNPEERVVSAYNYARSMGWLDTDTSLEDFVSADFLGNSDVMVRQLVHDRSLDTTAEPAVRKAARAVVEADYDAAVSNIENHFHFAAPISSFDDALVMLALEYQWPLHKLLYRRENITRLKLPAGALTPKVREMIAERNKWDLRLFATASTQFNERLEVAHHQSSKTFEKYKVMQSAYGKARSGRVWSLSIREARELAVEGTKAIMTKATGY